MSTDFSHLYRALGLQPDCSLDAFRQAYRRFVSLQHPDRPQAPTQDPDRLALADVIRLHDQALQFHQRHGRLPGSTVRLHAPVDRGEGRATSAATVESVADARSNAPPDVAQAPVRTPWLTWVAVAGVIALPIVFWQAPDEPAAKRASPVRHPVVPVVVTRPAQLQLGMDAATVRAIQGEPMRRRDGEWDYGPSWLRFSKGKLVDWYSSPLYQLRTPSPTAPPVVAKPAALE